MKRARHLLLLFLALGCSYVALGQGGVASSSSQGTASALQTVEDPWSIWMDPDTTHFETIRQQVEQYYANKDKGRGSGYKQWKRYEYKMEKRLTNDGHTQNYAAQNFLAFIDYFDNYQAPAGTSPDAAHGQWDPLGITNYSTSTGWNGGVGRVNCIAFHPTLSNTIWVGTPAGGLWKTTNGGTTWIPQTDGMPIIGVSGIAIHPTNTNIQYILTGDGDGRDTYSIGVMKSTDGGDTWKTTGLTWTISDEVRPYKLLMDPSAPNTLFVVSNDGIHRSTDGGVSWVREKTGTWYDIEFMPNYPDTMYASNASQFWKSTDNGDNWTRILDPNLPTGTTRIAIGVTPANVNYVYLMTGPPTGVGSFKGVYRSFTRGDTWGQKATTPNLLGYAQNGNDNDHQTTYDLAIAVSRTDHADLIVGGINTWASDNFGNSFYITSWWDQRGNTIGYTHADIHALEINPLNNYLYCGSDGGIFRSTDFGNNWTDLSSSLEITQWYGVGGVETNLNLLAGGTQDNGSNFWTGGSSIDHVRGADGMQAMISHANTNTRYTTRQYGILEKTTNAGSTWSLLLNPGGPWVTPLMMDPSTANTIYIGLSNMRKSTTGGTSWTSLGVDGRDALAMGTNNTNRLYAANNTVIQMSSDGGSTWTNISAGLPAGRNITGITVNPDWSLDVWVTLDGFASGQKVYRSTDAGTTWTNVSGTLPNVSVNCIAYSDHNGSPNDALYLGTDVGMFYRDDDIGDWIYFSNGLPVVPVFDIEVYEGSNKVYAVTHGRGIWESALYSSCPTGYTLNPTNDPSNPNYTGIQEYKASSWINSTRVVTGGVGTDVTYQAGTYVDLKTGFHAQEDNLFIAKTGPCGNIAPGAPPQAAKYQKIPVKGVFTGSILGPNAAPLGTPNTQAQPSP